MTKKVGYAAAELGVVWKTVDGGDTWEQVVNVGFPIYFYGVEALSPQEVVVSGFDNAAGFEEAALVWRTLDGGETWNSDIGMDPYWAMRVRFADHDHGLIAFTSFSILLTRARRTPHPGRAGARRRARS